jgi:hypothetical protein
VPGVRVSVEIDSSKLRDPQSSSKHNIAGVSAVSFSRVCAAGGPAEKDRLCGTDPMGLRSLSFHIWPPMPCSPH